jgi:hypothetical protein
VKQARFGACSVDGSSIHKLEISVARAMCSRRICGNANRLEDMRRDRNGTVAVLRDREFRPVWFCWISRCPKMNGPWQAATSEGLGFNVLDQIQTVLAG